MIEIRDAKIDDAAQILALQKLCYQSEAELYQNWKIPPLTQTLDELRKEFSNKTFLVVRSGTDIIGSVRAEETNGVCSVGRLIVHPAFQRRGIGRALMQAIEARYPNAMVFRLFTGEKSISNIKHYQSHGYSIKASEQISSDLRIVIMEKAALN